MKNLIIIASVITAFSCSKKDEPVAVVNQNILYKTITALGETKYTTDGKKLFLINELFTRKELFFDANNSINKVTFSGIDNSTKEEFHTYDVTNGNIVKSVYKFYSILVNTLNIITYDNSKPVLSYRNEKTTPKDGITSTVIISGTLEFDGKNLIKNTFSELNTNNIKTENISYDNKVNPFSNLFGFSKILLDFDNHIIINSAANNPLRYEFKRGNFIDIFNYVYTYNSDNYPIKTIINEQPSLNTEFFYK